jgi:hypothetical protein
MEQLTEREQNTLIHVLTQIYLRPEVFNPLLTPSGTPEGFEPDYSVFARDVLQKLGIFLPTR